MPNEMDSTTKCQAIAEWLGITVRFPEPGQADPLPPITVVDGIGAYWNPSTDITLWHDGLFEKIEEKGSKLCDRFLDSLCSEIGTKPPSRWCGGVLVYDVAMSVIRATTAQLTAALVAVLKEEQDED